MITKRKLKEENIRQQYRILELEELLCPCEDHDWKHVDSHVEFIGGDLMTMHKYKCRRCLKIKESVC